MGEATFGGDGVAGCLDLRGPPEARESEPFDGFVEHQRGHGADLAVTTDYRNVLHEVLTKRVGLADTKAIFPGFEAKDVLGAC
jgi:hypothetical protein